MITKKFVFLLLRWIDMVTLVIKRNPNVSDAAKSDLMRNVDDLYREIGDTQPLVPPKEDDNVG